MVNGIGWWSLQAQRADKHRAIARAVWSSAHLLGWVHVAAPDGHWCVRPVLSGLLLWVPLADPPSGMSASAVIYDEAARLRG